MPRLTLRFLWPEANDSGGSLGWVHWLSSPGIGPHHGDLAGCQGVADFQTDAGLSSVTLGLILLALLRGVGIALPGTMPAGPEQHHIPWLASAMPCASKAAWSSTMTPDAHGRYDLLLSPRVVQSW